MTETKGVGSLVRFFCTAGNGMELFLADEVKKKLDGQDVCQMSGKVLFSSCARMTRVSELKSAERLFLLLKQDSPVNLPAHTSRDRAADVLRSKLVSDRNLWTSTVMTWRYLQGELAGKLTTVPLPNTTAFKKGWEEQRLKEGKSDVVEFEDHSPDHGVEESENETCCRQNGNQTAVKKTNRETVYTGETASRHICETESQMLKKKRRMDSISVSSEEQWRLSDSERTRKDKDETKMVPTNCGQNELCGRGSVCDQDVESHEMTENYVVGILKQAMNTGKDKIVLQPSSDDSELLSSSCCVPVSFRISCKCTGSLSRILSIQEVSKVIGAGLRRLLGWTADLKNPQLEVTVYLSDDHCLLGIPLTRLPLANRSYIKTTGLRSTVAWAMASLAEIQPGHLVVDPMCGVGTILIEAAQEQLEACFLGMDIDEGQLQKANGNVEFAQLGSKVLLLKASSMAMPLPCSSVDAVVCDLPFGRKFGTKTNMATNLPLILTEIERVLRVGGTMVLLLSPQLSCILKKILAQKGTVPTSSQETESQTDHPLGLQHTLPQPLSSLKHQTTRRVSLGTIDGLIQKYVKRDI